MRKTILAISCLVALGALSAAPSRAAEPKKAEPKKAAAKKAGPSEEEMMKVWMAYATPGREHELLKAWEGTWSGPSKSWMDPSKPPDESETTEAVTSVLGGRFIESRFKGKMMGQPFDGIGYTGYDNGKKKWQTFWIDSAGTGMLVMEGVPDPAGKSMTLSGTFDDIATKRKAKIRSKSSFPVDGKYLYEMWMEGPDGKMFKSLEIALTKQ